VKTKLLITAILLFASIVGNTQETAIKGATLMAPEQSTKISIDDYKSFAKSRFTSDKGINKNSKNIYKVGNIVVAFWDLVEDDSYKRTLIQVQKEGLSMLTKQQVVDESVIKTINNAKILIFKYHQGDEYSYRFYSETRRNISVSGLVHFKATDRAKAEIIFEKLISTIKLKN